MAIDGPAASKTAGITSASSIPWKFAETARMADLQFGLSARRSARYPTPVIGYPFEKLYKF